LRCRTPIVSTCSSMRASSGRASPPASPRKPEPDICRTVADVRGRVRRHPAGHKEDFLIGAQLSLVRRSLPLLAYYFDDLIHLRLTARRKRWLSRTSRFRMIRASLTWEREYQSTLLCLHSLRWRRGQRQWTNPNWSKWLGSCLRNCASSFPARTFPQTVSLSGLQSPEEFSSPSAAVLKQSRPGEGDPQHDRVSGSAADGATIKQTVLGKPIPTARPLPPIVERLPLCAVVQPNHRTPCFRSAARMPRR